MTKSPAPQPGISPTEAPALSAAREALRRAMERLNVYDEGDAIPMTRAGIIAINEAFATLIAKTGAGVSTQRVEEIRRRVQQETPTMVLRVLSAHEVAEMLRAYDAQAAKLTSLEALAEGKCVTRYDVDAIRNRMMAAEAKLAALTVEPGEVAARIEWLRGRAKVRMEDDKAAFITPWFGSTADMLESLARERAELMVERGQLRQVNSDWLAANGPGGMAEPVLEEKCKACGIDVSLRQIWCDEIEGQWCDDCFEDVTHCERDHGEGCATIVMSDGKAAALAAGGSS